MTDNFLMIEALEMFSKDANKS